MFTNLFNFKRGVNEMKVLTKSVMTAVIFAWLSLGVSSVAHAVDTITPGSACQPYFGPTASKIDAQGDGVFTGVAAVWVTCPIVRTTSAATAVNPAHVNFFNNGGTVSCTLFSYEWNGELKGANQGSTTTTGDTFLTLKLPASASSKFSHLSVVCQLPPHSGIHNVFVTR